MTGLIPHHNADGRELAGEMRPVDHVGDRPYSFRFDISECGEFFTFLIARGEISVTHVEEISGHGADSLSARKLLVRPLPDSFLSDAAASRARKRTGKPDRYVVVSRQRPIRCPLADASFDESREATRVKWPNKSRRGVGSYPGNLTAK